jgi:phage/plasmid-like protein (TIGR03299 family)
MSALVESMAWVGDRGLPWWVNTSEDRARIKTELDGLATGPRIRVAAGLDWSVEKEAIRTESGVVIPDRFATVRQDTKAPLGVVGRSYTVVNNDALDEWGDALVDASDAKYETAGSLRGGRVVFYSMELNHLEINVGGDAVDEAIKVFLLLTNTHDGSRSLEALITPVRVVCANTLTMAMHAATASFRLRHIGSMDGKIMAAREALGITFRYVDALKANAEKLILKQVVDAQVFDIMSKAVWPVDPEWTPDRMDRSAAVKAFDLYRSADNLANIRGTAWGALNAVAEYADHEAAFAARGAGSTADVRASSILYGNAKRAKERALTALLKA